MNRPIQFIFQNVAWWAIELALVAWATAAWRGITRPGWTTRTRRSKLAVVSYLFGTVGLVYQLYMFIHAQITGGYEFYSRPTLAYVQLGLLLSLAGIALAACSKGSPRVYALGMNILMLIFVLIEGVAQ
jgi:hypothetical protein